MTWSDLHFRQVTFKWCVKNGLKEDKIDMAKPAALIEDRND